MEVTLDKFDPSKVHSFIVEGDPVSWSRAGVNQGRFYDKQKHLKLIMGIHVTNQFKGEELLSGPLALYATFHFRIPKTRSQKLMGTDHTQTPDIDNCCKFLLDLCGGILYRDDRIVSQVIARKVWSNSSYSEFSFVEL